VKNSKQEKLKFMKKTAIIITVLAFALTAFADQAAYIQKNDTLHAVALLKNKKQIRHFCKPCGDKTYRVEDIKTVESSFTNYENFWEVKLNGGGIDLAYIYYIDHTGKWRNMADRLNLEVSDVPKYLPDEAR
jgi:LPS sulfotransferase NodH